MYAIKFIEMIGSYELANLDVYVCTFNLFIKVTFIMKLKCD